MSKRKRIKKVKKRQYGSNKHHLIFQHRHYSRGYAKLLREAFVYEIPIDVHNELHNVILHDIPRPSDTEIREMYQTYISHKELFEASDVLTVCEWLATACRDPAWQACMMRQYKFLKSKMDGM